MSESFKELYKTSQQKKTQLNEIKEETEPADPIFDGMFFDLLKRDPLI